MLDNTIRYISSHFVIPRRVRTIYRQDNCNTKTLTKIRLLKYLTITHGIPVRIDSLKQAQFCYKYSEFFIYEDIQEDYYASYIINPTLFYRQIICRGIIIFARKYIFCLADSNLLAAQRYYNFNYALNFFRYLNIYLRTLRKQPVGYLYPKYSI